MNWTASHLKTPVLVICLLMLFNCCQSRRSLSPQYYEDIAPGKNGAVAGQIINIDTGEGIPGLKLEMIAEKEDHTIECTTGKDGHFNMDSIPGGTYLVLGEVINGSNRAGLLLDEFPQTIKVIAGKILKNVWITFKTGAVVSGYVYAADGVTPLKDVNVEVNPFDSERSWTNKQGKYKLVGLDEGELSIYAIKPGFPGGLKSIAVKLGKTYELNFELGKDGNTSVHGRIVSAKDNQPVKNALLFFDSTKVGKASSFCRAESDCNGEYYITGLKGPATFELSIVHWQYYEIGVNYKIKLKVGKNTLDFKLHPSKKEYWKKRKSDFIRFKKTIGFPTK
ncbi:MAG: carboxypeptidase regulatory-like domain-containing protein [bacterium]|nr:carboxypeptidase regulatory-like domain-containing protein [bacterium]